MFLFSAHGVQEDIHFNRRNLQRADGQYILGEKLRSTNINEEALNRGGRFKIIRENLHIKEVFVGEGSGRRRFVIAYICLYPSLDL